MRRVVVILVVGWMALAGLLIPGGSGGAQSPEGTVQPAEGAPSTLAVTETAEGPSPTMAATEATEAGTGDEGGMRVVEERADHKTGEWVRFTARVTSDRPIEMAFVFFQARPEDHTETGKAGIRKLNDGDYQLSYTHKIEDYFIRPFSSIDYRWEITPEGGEIYKSPAYNHFYEDQRFEWNVLEQGDFQVNWYNLEPAPEDKDLHFALSIINAAHEGFKKAQSYLPIHRPQQLIKIYIYTDSEALQGALAPNSRSWVAGHADPDLGVIVAALPPGPERAMLVQQRIPHELMHVLLYQYTAPGYENLPSWLSEGLSSLVELYPSSDYDYLLKTAVESNALIPISALCGPFPRDASGALLSYAEATSFTRYLHSEYGLTGIDTLTRTYANGLDCERGARRALGRSLSQLERNWRGDVLAENLAVTALNNLMPWISLAVIVFALPLTLVLLGLRKRRVENV